MPHNKGFDQAEGLRRMLSPDMMHRISFVSAVLPHQKNVFMKNLASALVRSGSNVHLIDASQSGLGVSCCLGQSLPGFLSDSDVSDVTQEMSEGIYVSQLSRLPISQLADQPSSLEIISAAVRGIKPANAFCLVDVCLDCDNPFLLPEFAQGDIIILASGSVESIKSAYMQLRTIHRCLGRRSYQLIIINSLPDQAMKIQQNISNAVSLYLAVPLIFSGSIPLDNDLSRADKLGRSVVDVFPMALSSKAYRGIAAILSGGK